MVIILFMQFRFATCGEVTLVISGLVFGCLLGLCMPLSIIMYGEFSSLLVDRNMENHTSTPTIIMNWFGGGKVL